MTVDIYPLFDKFNAIAGIFVAIMSYVLGEHWVLFAAFLLFNLTDLITGVIKARSLNKDNSQKGLLGLLKKLGYWIMIAVAFLMGAVFVEIGEVIGVNLHITTMLGWFVLASLMINEIRSIFENLVEAGYDIPVVLIKGLEVADKAMNAEESIDGILKIDNQEGTDSIKFMLDRPIEELKSLGEIKLKIETPDDEKESDPGGSDEPS